MCWCGHAGPQAREVLRSGQKTFGGISPDPGEDFCYGDPYHDLVYNQPSRLSEISFLMQALFYASITIFFNEYCLNLWAMADAIKY